MKTGKMNRKNLKLNRFAVSVVFFINGAIFGSWFSNIPFVQSKLGLSEGLLSIAFLSLSIGALFTLIITGWLIKRFGSKIIIIISTLSFCMSILLPFLSDNFIMFILSMFAMGMINGAMDVSMNTQAVCIEKKYKKPVMSSIHAFFSLGGLISAGIVKITHTLNIGTMTYIIFASIILGTAGMSVFKWLLKSGNDSNTGSGDAPVFALPTGPLIGLSVLMFLAFSSEGSIGDWSAVYLSRNLKVDEGTAAIGYAAFSLMMVAGRISGDYLVKWFGTVRFIRISTGIASIGLGVALFIGNPVFSIIAFGFVGLGMSNVVPVLFSAAGRVDGIDPGYGIASTATLGYFGLLAGPAIIGFTAEMFSLSIALFIIVISIAIISIFSGIVKKN